MRDVYICHAYRTPIGITGGCLSTYNAETLASMTMQHIVKKAKLRPQDIDSILLGNAVGHGGNIARLSSTLAFHHHAPPATTIDFQCGSSLVAIITGSDRIRCGRDEIVLVGGMESTSTEPEKILHPKDEKSKLYPKPLKRAPFSSIDVGDPEMLEGAENTARLFGVSREALDDIALESHQRALESDLISSFILPISNEQGDPCQDEGIRPKMSKRLLSRLPGLVGEGSVTTTGNACLKHDGAACMILASEEAVKKHKLKVLAKVIDSQMVSVHPNYSPIGALKAMNKLTLRLRRDIALIEVNEAFAVKTWLLKNKGYGHIPINPLGGALAYGHPYGASGAIITIHAMASLKAGQVGLVTMGVAGGQGVAMAIERVE